MGAAVVDRAGAGTGSSVKVTEDSVVIRIGRPEASDRAALVGFAARADCYQGLVMWHRYEAVYTVLQDRTAELAADPDADAYTRLYDPQCQVAASFAAASGVRQCTAEFFLERAIACMDRIPAVGRLMRDGLITPAWFARAVEQVSLVVDADLLAVIDAEIAHRLAGMGSLSAARVEAAIAAVVTEFDPDAVTLTREQVKASKSVSVEPVNEDVSALTITTSVEDAKLCWEVIEAIAAGVCPNDPRTKAARRADAAVARLQGTEFGCQCGEDDCLAELSAEQVAARCARIVLHVVVREETLDGAADTPAWLDGFGPVSAPHVRELATRRDATRRPVNLDEVLAGRCARAGDPYRPTTGCDVLVRALFGTCTWAGCDRPAFDCDLDHVAEFDHVDPAAGGPTCVCNLNPKCRFHHGLKTHADGWLDDQIVDANGVIWTEVTGPEGITARQRAQNLWLLPELGHMQCRHGQDIAGYVVSTTRPESRHAEDEPERARTRTQAKHRYRRRQRAVNRHRREAVEAAAVAYGEPPF
ncbi:DUF222 domain-containing protein [Gordonia sp. (in: high G+C Gram-positive bacteria)]|uniref:DUF222 domain-containing protein n=1 Tax=Gordonia sp. (in: high G+C Gram-positive bacteria) TaxID=84139 RepID=UPI003C716ABB